MSRVVQAYGYAYALKPIEPETPRFEDHPNYGTRSTSLETAKKVRK